MVKKCYFKLRKSSFFKPNTVLTLGKESICIFYELIFKRLSVSAHRTTSALKVAQFCQDMYYIGTLNTVHTNEICVGARKNALRLNTSRSSNMDRYRSRSWTWTDALKVLNKRKIYTIKVHYH
jgi:hypothetical protein